MEAEYKQNVFARTCMKYANLHRKVMFAKPTPWGWGVNFQICSLLGMEENFQINRKVFFLNPQLPWGGSGDQFQKQFLVKI